MKKNFVKNLANDLLRLEINTIVKDQLLCDKARSHRWELYDIAGGYRELLTSYSIAAYPPIIDKEKAIRKEFKHMFAGLASFLEIQEFAEHKQKEFQEVLLHAHNFPERITDELREKVILCERIIRQAQHIIDIFMDLKAQSNDPIKSDNEFPQMRLDYLEDLELRPDQITTIRKANEIGTQRVLLQTVVQVEGDITSYITNRFLHFPQKEQEMIMKVHEGSITTSIRMWQYLFQAVSKLAGNVFTGITGKQLNSGDTSTTVGSLRKPDRIG